MYFLHGWPQTFSSGSQWLQFQFTWDAFESQMHDLRRVSIVMKKKMDWNLNLMSVTFLQKEVRYLCYLVTTQGKK